MISYLASLAGPKAVAMLLGMLGVGGIVRPASDTRRRRRCARVRGERRADATRRGSVVVLLTCALLAIGAPALAEDTNPSEGDDSAESTPTDSTPTDSTPTDSTPTDSTPDESALEPSVPADPEAPSDPEAPGEADEAEQPPEDPLAPPVAEQLADLRGDVRPVLGPSGHIDSLYVSVRDSRGRQQAYMSNTSTSRYRVGKGGRLYDGVTVLRRGAKGSVDQCGVHMAGPILKVTKNHWVAWYHGDKASPRENHECRWGGRQIRGAVYRVETFDQGRTWRKRERVLSQDQRLMSWDADRTARKSVYTDDAGSPRFVIRRGYVYMVYRAINYDTGKPSMNIARSRVSKQGRGGTWWKKHLGEWSQPGLGGRSTPINLPDNKRGLTWNTHLDSYVTAHANQGGIWIYRTQGRDLTEWTLYAQVGNPIPRGESWGHKCDPRTGLRHDGEPMPEARGYGVSIGLDGSSWTSGQEFWVYWMWKPLGKCFTHRYLVRQKVRLR